MLAMGIASPRNLLWLGMLGLLCSRLWAQDSVKPADVGIQVTDESGGIVQGARVRIAPSPSVTGRSFFTDDNGRIHVQLLPGSYALSVRFPGFFRASKRVDVRDSTPQMVSIVLKVGRCSPCLTVTTTTGPHLVSFPEESESVSPDQEFALVDLDGGAGQPHKVAFEDRDLGARNILFTYRQHASILWNIKSEFFAVTEYLDADDARCKIYSVDDRVSPVLASDQLLDQLAGEDREKLRRYLSNKHVRIEATEWIGLNDLELRVSGYGQKEHGKFAENYQLHVRLPGP